jgi:geranylgeranyl diphosphate synthase type I
MQLQEKTNRAKIEYVRASVEARIEETLAHIEPAALRKAMMHSVFGGKLVRPMLTLLSCEAVGGKMHATLDAATSVELLHLSSLIHDDIMDASAMRRGRTTVHTEFGVPLAILAGDTFVALAFQLMQSLHSPNKDDIVTVFTQAFRHVCEGQGYDLSLTSTSNAENDAHTTMVEKKTAKLFEAAATIGALCGTINREHIDALALFGYNVGMAFQAQDDLLDATGNERSLGKPVAVDVRNRRGTFLSLVYPSRDASTKLEHAVAATTSIVETYTKNACRALDALPPSEALTGLRLLAESLVHRKD